MCLGATSTILLFNYIACVLCFSFSLFLFSTWTEHISGFSNADKHKKSISNSHWLFLPPTSIFYEIAQNLRDKPNFDIVQTSSFETFKNPLPILWICVLFSVSLFFTSRGIFVGFYCRCLDHSCPRIDMCFPSSLPSLSRSLKDIIMTQSSGGVLPIL